MKQILFIKQQVYLGTALAEAVGEEANGKESEWYGGVETLSSGSECDSDSSLDSLGSAWKGSDCQNFGNCRGYCLVDFW